MFFPILPPSENCKGSKGLKIALIEVSIPSLSRVYAHYIQMDITQMNFLDILHIHTVYICTAGGLKKARGGETSPLKMKIKIISDRKDINNTKLRLCLFMAW